MTLHVTLRLVPGRINRHDRAVLAGTYSPLAGT